MRGVRRGTSLLGRIILIIAFVVAAIIVIGILLVLLSANPSNGIVKAVSDAARFLVGPFKDLFTIKDPKAMVAVNYGIAAAVYLAVASLLATLLRKI